MKLNSIVKVCLSLLLVCFFTTTGFCASSYDRELIVQDKTRAMQVESVFKEMMAAYEDEDARSFLDYVSDDRFRQDYITFTDALYSDFRNYEIHQVEYWNEKVVPDNVKQFLHVEWEKRYENLDDGQQITRRGASVFLFDEVDGDYLLVEVQGNHLFGGSLQEWRDEVPPIAGQELETYVAEEGAVCGPDHLSLCDGSNCSSNGGDWYNNTCNSSAQSFPDLVIVDISYSVSEADVYIDNIGTAASASCVLHWTNGDVVYDAVATIPPISAGGSATVTVISQTSMDAGGQVTLDSTNVVDEGTAGGENNNVSSYP